MLDKIIISGLVPRIGSRLLLVVMSFSTPAITHMLDKIEEKTVKSNDEALMERVMRVVNKHLDDSDFTVEMMAAEVGISRTHLQRRMKDITGLNVKEFVRHLRLEQAARMLQEQKLNVSQVAYSVGFSNLAHFSTVFRKHFGISPTEYVSQKCNR